MKVIPKICGKNHIHLPSICDESGRFIGLTDETIMQGDTFNPLAGVYAVDENGNRIPYEVNPTSINTCNVGDFTFIYSTTEFVADRTITIIRSAPPTIHFPSGAMTCDAETCEAVVDPNSIGIGEQFDTLSGVTATDAHGNSVTVTCQEGSTVVFTTGGRHYLHYTATDACGNVGTATRTVVALAGTFSGVQNVSVPQGTAFDPRDGVVAKSYDGTVIPFTVTPSTFAPCQLGTQIFTYSADGVESVNRTVSVTPINNPTILGTSDAIEVSRGEEFDPLDGVTAIDGHGNTLTVTVVVEP